MAESHVISALVSKRAELAGLVQHHKKEISRLSRELVAIDRSIKIFDPEYKITGIRPVLFRKKNFFFKRGESQRLFLDILREAGGPMSTIEIVHEIIKRKQFELESDDLTRLKTTISSRLKKQADKGYIKLLGTNKAVNVWGLD